MQDLLEKLLDRNNHDLIVLTDGDRTMAFEQIAVIPLPVAGKIEIFAILKPVDMLEGSDDGELMFFCAVMGKDGQIFLRAETDSSVVQKVYDIYCKQYYKLFVPDDPDSAEPVDLLSLLSDERNSELDQPIEPEKQNRSVDNKQHKEDRHNGSRS